ncbi:oxidoreductase [Desulfotignum phosphitoxidans]|uniref:Flavin oxidoreductase/NADH oxidase NADH n=1 Tax=Desulfotignum phosphitoxidans DSM 13687 TaxID=1286635 RepID=S0G7B3_9BACT|nr:NADH:flavin oxidoreductase [Desulfotignum phosphitoxidans]EMS80721.1 flavin oxidoreductase/NADH oxidase NADH [Desulfotignum phosphitoxidans DSM 13687]
MYNNLFSEITIKGLTLKNRLTMAPLYLGYAGEGGTVSNMLLDHYRLMAGSGVAMVVVENATVDHPCGSGSNRTLRADTDDNLDGLKRLSAVIKQEGALACLQINHAGRFAHATQEPVAPSAVNTFGRMPRALDREEIASVMVKYAEAAARAKSAGFDMVELHGGTGYLLAQFLSPRTNHRTDEYGGSLENRQRFALGVLSQVKKAVGEIPVGYRFLADEWLPDGLKPEESRQFAISLAKEGIDYISVMGGTYESFLLPEILEKSRQEGYMLDLAAEIRAQVDVPVIAAGRFATGAFADRAIRDGKTDLIGLARVLWADPKWPEKIHGGREDDIIHCDPDCLNGGACMQMVMKGRPAFCVAWPAEKMKAWKTKFI